MNNPINAIDPDGKVVIFTGGMHWGEGGNKAYWGSFADKVMKKIGDYKARYYDGSSGGMTNTIFGLVGSNFFAYNRRHAGRVKGYGQAAEIFANLKDGETIKIITHSMGGA